MKRRLLSIVLAAVLAVGSVMPVSAAAPQTGVWESVIESDTADGQALQENTDLENSGGGVNAPTDSEAKAEEGTENETESKPEAEEENQSKDDTVPEEGETAIEEEQPEDEAGTENGVEEKPEAEPETENTPEAEPEGETETDGQEKADEKLLVHYNADSFQVADGRVTGLRNQAGDTVFDAVQADTAFQPEYIAASDLEGKPAMRMEDTSYLQIGPDGGFDLTDMTMAVVLKPNRLEAEKSQICSRKQEGGGNHNWYWNVEAKTGLNFGWKQQGENNWSRPSVNPILHTGDEYVLLVQKDGTRGRIFVNGVETTFEGGEIPEYSDEKVYLGTPANADGEVSINADICEFRIYNYALEETELKSLQEELMETYLEETSGQLPSAQMPAGVDGLKIWLDAEELQLQDGERVTEWKNKADTEKYHGVQPDAAKAPVYIAVSDLDGKPAVKLQKDWYLEIDQQLHPDDVSIFAVIRAASMDENGDYNQIISKLGDREPWDHNWYFNISGGGFNFGWKDADGYHDYQNPNRNLAVDVNYILGGVKAGNEGSLYVNQRKLGTMFSSASDSAAVHNDVPIYVGGTGNARSLDGWIGEILVYDRGLTAEETEKVQEYLGTKWGIEKAEDPASLTGSIFIDGEELRGFSPNTARYKHTVAHGAAAVPVVTADFSKSGASVTVKQADSIPGEAAVTVTKGGTTKTYTIAFSELHRDVVNLTRPSMDEVTITGGFWDELLKTFRTTTINHVFDNLERTGTLENFKKVGTPGARPDGNTDPWNDGLLFETIRAAGDFYKKYPDAALKARVDGYIDIVYEASRHSENGYLSTWAMMEKPGKYFDETGNARWYHDCYNFGCMAEAAVHWYEATGDTKLLYVATRFAEFLVDNYGYGTKADGTPKINMVPSHEGPEEMLLKLYELYRDEKSLKDRVNAQTIAPYAPLDIDEEEYKSLVQFWIENRGNYDNRVNGVSYDVYAQDHARYFDQDIAAGHAVRANLFYTGMAAAGLEFMDYTYLSSAEALWQNIVDKQMYITGGVGAQGADEAYGPNYDLPNDGYCETCAQVAMGFFSEYMGRAFGESKYADILENYIYNGVLGCVGLDGKTFYYQQPLTEKNRGRWEWLTHTPCCPPMFLKFYSELSTYIYAYNSDRVYVNQFISSEGILGNGVKVKQQTEMPWGGVTSLSVTGNTTLYIRIPDWADQAETTLEVNGQKTPLQLEDGYAVVKVYGSADVKLTLPMEARREYSDPNVVYNQGKVALAYGPLVYCVEGTDNEGIPEFQRGDGNFGLPKDRALSSQFEKDLLGGVQTITFEGQYYDSNGQLQDTEVKAIPFYARANRGSSATFVWFDETVREAAGENKRWLAHATSSRDNGNSAAAAFDGNLDTYWSAGSPELPQALMVDLGKETSISQVKTTFTSAQAWKYQIVYSDDGKNWEMYADRSTNATQQQEYVDEKEQTAHYLAVKFVESAGVGFISVKDVAVLDEAGNNVALDKLCGASSTSNVAESVFAALDGQKDTRYCPPGEAKPQALTMDMGQQADITGINILFEKETDWTYQIEVSPDGQQWETYYSGTERLTEKEITKDAAGRYVRFTITGTTGGVWASAWEFDVQTRQELTDVFDVLLGEAEEKPDEGDKPGEGEEPDEGDKPGEGEKPDEGDKPDDGNRPSDGNSGSNASGTSQEHHGGDGEKQTAKASQTGDATPLAGLFGTALASTAFVTILLIWKKKKERTEK